MLAEVERELVKHAGQGPVGCAGQGPVGCAGQGPVGCAGQISVERRPVEWMLANGFVSNGSEGRLVVDGTTSSEHVGV